MVSASCIERRCIGLCPWRSLLKMENGAVSVKAAEPNVCGQRPTAPRHVIRSSSWGSQGYIHGSFSEAYLITIGTTVSKHVAYLSLEGGAGMEVSLTIWTSWGAEGYRTS